MNQPEDGETAIAETQSEACAALNTSFGAADGSASAWAPGRCTIVGEHVDYAGGMILCAAIQLGIAACVRPSRDGMFRAVSGSRLSERRTPQPVGDIGDRIFAAAIALERAGVKSGAIDAGIASTLPESAGLASSAAVACSVIVATLRCTGTRLTADQVLASALHAEHDIVGVPSGPLDQTAIVKAPASGVLLFDSASGAVAPLPWPWDDVVLCVCDTGESHDVAGPEYRARREQVERGLAMLGAANAQALDPDDVARTELPLLEAKRLRHVVTESRRATAAAGAVRRADASELGALMNASHRSLRDDHEVSTPLLNAVVNAAVSTDGCYGARLVGAGFGGSVVALVFADAIADCRSRMAQTAGVDIGRTWIVHPHAGLAMSATDVITGG
jgi:galactokinase